MNARDTVHIALFAGIIGALGLVPPIPAPLIPAPITAQTLGVMLAGSILGARQGAASALLFLVIVAIGMPLLSGGRGGLGVFVGPTAGFLLAWPAAAFVIGAVVQRLWGRLNVVTAFGANVVGGIGVVYLVGIPVLALAARISLAQAALGSMVFLPGDLLKAAVAAGVVLAVRRGYPAVHQSRA